jgi:hypothetical protein
VTVATAIVSATIVAAAVVVGTWPWCDDYRPRRDDHRRTDGDGFREWCQQTPAGPDGDRSNEDQTRTETT